MSFFGRSSSPPPAFGFGACSASTFSSSTTGPFSSATASPFSASSRFSFAPSSTSSSTTTGTFSSATASPFSASSGFSFAPSSTSSSTTTGSTSSATSQTSESICRTNSTASATIPVVEDTEDDWKQRAIFLGGFFMAFKERTHTDILLKPNNGPCIPAHKALLAARSEIFKNMLDSDSCKAPPSDVDTITLSELNIEELESLLEFLYTGNLPLDKLEKHVFKLYVAADKYEIRYLQKSCECYMLNYLNISNALDILEMSDAHSNKKMKDSTLNFILKNMKGVVSSNKFEEFASSNPHLCVQMTRAFVDAKTLIQSRK